MNHSDLLSSHVLIDGLFRGVELASLLVLVGLQGFRLLVFRPDGIGEERALVEFADRFERRWAMAALWCFLLAMLGEFAHEAMEMTRRPFAEIGPFLWPILTKTHFGQISLVQLGLLAVYAAIWAANLRRRRLLLIIGALLCLTQSMSGHAANQGNWSPAVLVDWFHLLAVAFWAGGVVPLTLLVPRLLARLDPSSARTLLIRTLERFSPMAVVSVIVLVVAGALSARWRGVELPDLLTSEYGGVLLAKSLFAGAAVALGGVSRFLILPALRHTTLRSGNALRHHFGRVIAVELGVVAVALILAALLTQLPPPSSAMPMSIPTGMSMGE